MKCLNLLTWVLRSQEKSVILAGTQKEIIYKNESIS